MIIIIVVCSRTTNLSICIIHQNTTQLHDLALGFLGCYGRLKISLLDYWDDYGAALVICKARIRVT
jgi:hypothetical protein